MFIKPAGQSGGCVQLYYYMYGADIGTLNISVYDNTQSGLVANFQRTGKIIDLSEFLFKTVTVLLVESNFCFSNQHNLF